MKPKILALVPLYAPTLAELEREYTVHKLWTAKDPDALMKQIAGGVTAVVTTGLAGFSRHHVEALPRLKLIACFGNPHGMAAGDKAAAKARGVIVTNTPDSITDIVADLAMGLVLAAMRRIVSGDRLVRAGKWLEGPPPPGRDLGGKTLGIVGLGRIGSAIARRAEAFGMKVRWHGPRAKPDVTWPHHADLVELAKLSDCLLAMCPLTPQTQGIVNARVLDALGPEGYFVNVARGPVADQAALIAALEEKRIAGAALDVFWDEPRVPEALMAMDNVVLTPHLGSTVREIREERGRMMLANLRAHFLGQPVLTPVAL
jgi:lactate dehydrogenase-like 2-hydroxyacid dehydrogenase